MGHSSCFLCITYLSGACVSVYIISYILHLESVIICYIKKKEIKRPTHFDDFCVFYPFTKASFSLQKPI